MISFILNLNLEIQFGSTFDNVESRESSFGMDFEYMCKQFCC